MILVLNNIIENVLFLMMVFGKKPPPNPKQTHKPQQHTAIGQEK